MQLIINGKEENVTNGLSVSDLLKERGVETPETVAVELNGEILDHEEFDNINLKEKDKVEFIFFVGGGNFT
jgi:sulfur carrier protein